MGGSADRNQGEPVERCEVGSLRVETGEVKSILVKGSQFSGGLGCRNGTGYLECR
jgi:hypothetical protein